MATGKTEEKERNGDGARALKTARKQAEATQVPSPRQRGAKEGHGDDQNEIEARRR